MNYTQFTDNPREEVFVFAGLILYFLFRVFQYLINKYRAKTYKHAISKLVYFIEIIVWFAYLSEGVNLFAQQNLVVSCLCALILLFAISWTSWYILRDYLAGLFLKMSGTFKLDEIVDFDGFSGRITNIGNRSIQLEIASANTVTIPYHQFYIKRLISTGKSDNSAKGDFIFKLNPNLNAIDTIETIKVFIYQLPWTNNKNEQEVSIEKSDSEGSLIKINASLLDKKYFDRFQSKIKERFE
jgi:small-conductance mechanosensitive channel